MFQFPIMASSGISNRETEEESEKTRGKSKLHRGQDP